MKQGKADTSGRMSQKQEPRSRAVNPGGAANIGIRYGNHTTNNGSIPNTRRTPIDAGRGYKAPMAAEKRHPAGSQGKH